MLAAVQPAHPDENPADVLHSGDRVVFLGNTFADQLRLHGYVETLLTVRRPEHKLTFRNLGWSGDELTLQPRPLNFGSLNEHLADQRADVVVACFGMNESFDGVDEIAGFESDWTAFLKHLQGQKYNRKTPPRIVIVSPIRHEDIDRRLGDFAAHNEKLEAYVASMKKVADANGATFVDLFDFTQKLSNEGPSQKLTTNGIHLSAYGYWAAGHAVADVLAPAAASTQTALEAGSGVSINIDGCRRAEAEWDGDSLVVKVTCDRLAGPAPPEGSIVHPSLQQRLPTLSVRSLPAGENRYRLTAGDFVIAEATAGEWRQGVVLSGLSAQQQTELVRETVNRKNEWFFHRWRPANAEYVFGRRTKPFGSVSFPPEMEAYESLVDGQDREIQKLARPGENLVFKLSPIK